MNQFIKIVLGLLALILIRSEILAQQSTFPFGVAYYPEQWPDERLETDLKLMQDAGINCVRIGEFAWSKIEPQEGNIQFDFFDAVIEKLSEHGIRTVFATCSRTPPPWIFAKYPEILNRQKNGEINNYGQRYTVNLLHSKFIELSQQIDKTVIEHYSDNPNVIGWQIDNEIGARNIDYSDLTKQKFHDFLKQKYKSVSSLNDSWGAHFWSFIINDFSEIPLPTIDQTWGVKIHPGLMLDWNRFNSSVNTNFALWRRDLMKKEAPEKWITTNFQQSRATHTDIFELGEATDIYGTNFYPTGAHEFGLDLCRGGRGELLILEQRSGQPHWGPHTEPGMMRLWAWNSIAHGANGIFFFRWRPALFGQEEYWHGVLPHSGNPNRRYEELKQMGKEVAEVGDILLKTTPASKVAILMSYESRWASDAVRIMPELSVVRAAYRWHESLMANHVNTDALDPREDLSKYRLVIAPRLYLVDSVIQRNLENYVKKGGLLVLTFRSGVVDEFNKIHNSPAPGPLLDMSGVMVDDYGYLSASLPIKFENINLLDISATQWADEISLGTAESVANYNDGWLKGKPVITINNYGKGQVIYIGTAIQRPQLDNLTDWLLDLAKIQHDAELTQNIRVLKRENKDYELAFYLNFSNSTETIPLKSKGYDLFLKKPVNTITLAPFDIRIIKTDKN